MQIYIYSQHNHVSEESVSGRSITVKLTGTDPGRLALSVRRVMSTYKRDSIGSLRSIEDELANEPDVWLDMNLKIW
jgi:hypothetical protein